MKVLIIGGAGFIGLSLARLLNKKNFKVDILDSFSRGKKDKELIFFLDKNKGKLIEKDLNKLEVNEQMSDDYDFIFHFAAILGVNNVILSPYKVLEDNVKLTTQAISIAKKQKDLKCFIFASTSEVYAGTLRHGLLKIPTEEKSILALSELDNPRTSYMLSKIYGESLCIHSKLPYLILRPHNIYGPRMGMSHVIPQLMRKIYNLENGKDLEVFSPLHTRTFCFIDTAIEQIFNLVMNKDTINQAFNIGLESPEIKIIELARKIIFVTKREAKIKHMENTIGSPSRRCPSMKNTFNFMKNINTISLDQGLDITFRWYKENKYF